MNTMRVFEKQKTFHYLYETLLLQWVTTSLIMFCEVFKLPFFDLLSAVEKRIPVFPLFKSCLLTPKKPFLHFISLCSLFNSCKSFPYTLYMGKLLLQVVNFASQKSRLIFVNQYCLVYPDFYGI